MTKKHTPRVAPRPAPVQYAAPSVASNAGRAAGQVAKKATVSFMVANPLASLIIVVVTLAVMFIVGGVILGEALRMLLNPFMWIVAFIFGMLFRPKTPLSIAVLSVINGGIFWAYQIYEEYQAMQVVCNIPLLGNLICTTWDTALFLPRMVGLASYVVAAFVMMMLISMTIHFALNRKT